MYIYILLLAEYEICLSKHTHTHTNMPINQTSTKDSPEWLRLVVARHRTLEYPMAQWPSGSRAVSSRCKWVVSASRWDLNFDHWKSWTIFPQIFGGWKGWKCLPQFFWRLDLLGGYNVRCLEETNQFYPYGSEFGTPKLVSKTDRI